MLLQVCKENRLCEEKYSFTPDDFKAATRQQRKRDKDRTISHLKTRDEIISKTSFDKGVIKTDEGKNLIGTYLGRHADEIKLKENVIIDIDSESQIAGCKCKDASSNCICKTHAVALRCYFSKNTGLEKVEKLTEAHQRKGEAELAQVDWLIQAVPQMKPGESAVSIVTSGDIDAIPIHLFALSFQLPPNEQNKFINNVFVVLQKPHGKSDIYNITSIIEVLENMYKDKYVVIKVSLGLCLGGNDFVPKFHGKSHATILRLLFESPNLFRVDRCTDNVIINFDKEVYIDFVKHLFCPKTRNATQLSFEDVRVITIYGSKLKKSREYRNPQLWLPPEIVLKRVADIIILQIEYLLTVGRPNCDLPDFLNRGCLQNTDTGEIEYNFGPESSLSLPVPRTPIKKRQIDAVVTPKKTFHKKRLLMASTPKKTK